MNRFPSSLIFLSIAAACARAGPAIEPSPDIGPTPSPASVSTAIRSWSISPDSGPHTFSSRAVTIVELQANTGPTRDSFTVTTEFTTRTYRGSASTRISGTIDNLHREPSAVATEPGALPQIPLAFAGHVVSGGLKLDSIAGKAAGTVADCEQAGLNQMSTVQRNLPVVPLLLTTGASWTDSSTTSACSGTIPIQLTAVRTYTVLGEMAASGGRAIALNRIDRTTASGEGSQGQHRIEIQATGSGSAKLLLEPVTGTLRQSEGESRTDLTIRSSGRQQRFVQTVKETTTRLK